MHRTIISLLLLISCTVHAGLWFQDNNLATAGGKPTDFTKRTDAQWNRALQTIDTYYLRTSTASNLNAMELVKLSATLKKYGISTALDSGLATWGKCRVNRDFVHDIFKITQLKKLGFNVTHIGLQSVLSKPYKKRDNKCNEYRDINSYDGAVARAFDVIEYVKQIKQAYPDIKIGIIDALPAKIHDPENRYWYLYTEMTKRSLKLDFIHLDVPVSYPRDNKNNLSYEKLVKLTNLIKQYNIETGLFLASNVGGKQSGRDVTKYKVHGLHNLLNAGLRVNHLVSSGWFPYPTNSVPETDMSTSTGAVLKLKDTLDMWGVK